MSTPKIHWRRKYTVNTACGGPSPPLPLTAQRFLAKYDECPNVFCGKCARIARGESGVTFTENDVEHLRALAEYMSRGFVGAEAREGLRILKGKLS